MPDTTLLVVGLSPPPRNIDIDLTVCGVDGHGAESASAQTLQFGEASYCVAEKRLSNEFEDTVGWAPAIDAGALAVVAGDSDGAAAAGWSEIDGFSSGWAACLLSALGAAFEIDAS
jgi:hypothetical protein